MTEQQAENYIEANLDEVFAWLNEVGIPDEYITFNDNHEEDTERYVEQNRIDVVEAYKKNNC